MLAGMIDKIVNLKETKIFKIDDKTYSDRPLTLVKENKDRAKLVTVNSLDSICKLVKEEHSHFTSPLFIRIAEHNKIEVISGLDTELCREMPYTAISDVPHIYNGFKDREMAIIELRSLYIPNEDTEYLLELISRMTSQNSVSSDDNGVTQKVEVKQGIALNEKIEIKPRVKLRPFRTFLEVEQPESEFLLRVNKDEEIGLFEADGGVWKLEAKQNIARYLEKELAELIKQKSVIVMK